MWTSPLQLSSTSTLVLRNTEITIQFQQQQQNDCCWKKVPLPLHSSSYETSLYWNLICTMRLECFPTNSSNRTQQSIDFNKDHWMRFLTFPALSFSWHNCNIHNYCYYLMIIQVTDNIITNRANSVGICACQLIIHAAFN